MGKRLDHPNSAAIINHHRKPRLLRRYDHHRTGHVLDIDIRVPVQRVTQTIIGNTLLLPIGA